MKTGWKFITIFCLWVMVPSVAFADRPADEQEIREFINDIGNEAFRELGSTHLSEKQRQQKFIELFRKNFDETIVAMKILGTTYRELSDTQKRDFKRLLPYKLAKMFANYFKGYTPEKAGLKIKQVDRDDKGDTVVVVSVRKTNGQLAVFEWTVSKKLKLIDLSTDGVSIKGTIRAEFEDLTPEKVLGNLRNIESLIGSVD